MDSPTDPGSPISNSSGDTPPPEDVLMSESAPTQESFFGSSPALGPSNGKRRQPPTSFISGPAYSAKTRRREEGSGRRGGHQWAGGSEREGTIRLQKDELIDTQLVERIRNDWGDPFDESFLKNAN